MILCPAGLLSVACKNRLSKSLAYSLYLPFRQGGVPFCEFLVVKFASEFFFHFCSGLDKDDAILDIVVRGCFQWDIKDPKLNSFFFINKDSK